jgi:hypothetical protein
MHTPDRAVRHGTTCRSHFHRPHDPNQKRRSPIRGVSRSSVFLQPLSFVTGRVWVWGVRRGKALARNALTASGEERTATRPGRRYPCDQPGKGTRRSLRCSRCPLLCRLGPNHDSCEPHGGLRTRVPDAFCATIGASRHEDSPAALLKSCRIFPVVLSVPHSTDRYNPSALELPTDPRSN